VHALLTSIGPVVVRYCRAWVIARSGYGDAADIAKDICLTVLSGLSTFVGCTAPHPMNCADPGKPWQMSAATKAGGSRGVLVVRLP
jgi:hypothetical protein